MNRTCLIVLGLLAAPIERGLGEEWKPSREPALIPPEMFEIADPELEVTVWASLPQLIQSAGGVTQLVPKERIEKKRELGRSLMYEPASLGLNAQDIADLAAWLETYR